MAGLRTFLSRDGEYFEVKRGGQTVAAAVQGLYIEERGHVDFLPSAGVKEGDTLIRRGGCERLRVSRLEILTKPRWDPVHRAHISKEA